MQRTVDDHTNCMVRARSKCNIDREIFGNWSASAWETLALLHNTQTWEITRDAQGYHHLPPTLNYRVLSYSKVPVHLGTMPVYKETIYIPLGL
jgi:hypothetical protein